METHHDPLTITCFPSTFRTLDAVTSDAIEDSRGVVYLMDSDGTIPPPEIGTRVKVCWNPSSIFVIFQGKFVELRRAQSQPVDRKTGKTFGLWEHSDVYEVFIGLNARSERRYREFQAAPDSRRLDIDVDNRYNKVEGNFNWVSGFRCASFVDEAKGKWDCVMEIPWKALGGTPESKGEWNVNFCRATGRFHGDELLTWSPMGRGDKAFHQPEKFGRIVIQR